MRDQLEDQTGESESIFCTDVVNIMYLVTEIGKIEDLENMSLIFKDKASQPFQIKLIVSASYCFVTSCTKNSMA